MILYIENPKYATRNLLSSSRNLVMLQDTKLIYRNLLHSYILTMKNQKIKEIITITIATKRIKYLGINLPKETKYPYIENYKTLMK